MSESEEALYCVNHPKIETWLRCNRCGNPICPKCAVRTPVGFRCKQCIKGQQAAFYSATPLDYVFAVVIGLVAATIAAFIIGAVGLFFAFFLAPVAGGVIAEVVRWATGRRRGRWVWLVVSACIVVGALLAALRSMLPYLFVPEARMALLAAPLALISHIDLIIYVVLAIGVVYARLR
jgi:cytochrome bd-type quinol oxidase subunit 2